MKKIPITRGLFALVDDEDFDWLNKYNWSAQKGRHTFYAASKMLPKGEKIDTRKKAMEPTAYTGLLWGAKREMAKP